MLATLVSPDREERPTTDSKIDPRRAHLSVTNNFQADAFYPTRKKR